MDSKYPKALIGKTIQAIYLADDKMAIRFDVEGDEVIARTDGDCCSHSWIEAVENPEALIGSPVIEVRDLDSGERDEREYGEVVQHYGFSLSTARGTCKLDYRNESNGYYGGNLAWDGDYFYGGVHGQNVSSCAWKLIAGQAGTRPAQQE